MCRSRSAGPVNRDDRHRCGSVRGWWRASPLIGSPTSNDHRTGFLSAATRLLIHQRGRPAYHGVSTPRSEDAVAQAARSRYGLLNQARSPGQQTTDCQSRRRWGEWSSSQHLSVAAAASRAASSPPATPSTTHPRDAPRAAIRQHAKHPPWLSPAEGPTCPRRPAGSHSSRPARKVRCRADRS